jgi:hypothetical protein
LVGGGIVSTTLVRAGFRACVVRSAVVVGSVVGTTVVVVAVVVGTVVTGADVGRGTTGADTDRFAASATGRTAPPRPNTSHTPAATSNTAVLAATAAVDLLDQCIPRFLVLQP